MDDLVDHFEGVGRSLADDHARHVWMFAFVRRATSASDDSMAITS